MCDLTWFMSFWPGDESRGAREPPPRDDTCPLCLLVLPCVFSPVTINAAFHHREKITYNGTIDKPLGSRIDTTTQHLLLDCHRQKKHHSVFLIVLPISFSLGLFIYFFNVAIFPFSLRSTLKTREREREKRKPLRF